jgi:glycosyltransferase involved in cell wall biosynthesis
MEPAQLNICMYTPSADGGHARYTHEMLSALSEVGLDRGVNVSLVSSKNLSSEFRTSAYPIYDILPPLRCRNTFKSALPFKGFLSWAFSRAFHYYRRESVFMRWIEEHNVCEGIHFQEYIPWLALWHYRLLKARGKRVFYTVHDVRPTGNDFFWRLPKAIRSLELSVRRSAYRLCDGLFVLDDSLQRELADFLGKGHPPIYVAPHGVWRSVATADTAASFEERAKRRRLLFFGVLRTTKGLHVLLRAMRRLPDCTLTVAGQPNDAKYQEQIRALAKQLPPGRVELMERHIENDEVKELFEQSSLVILPYTYFGGQSGVLHDALAQGVPVVATQVGAGGDSVRLGGIGEAGPPNNDAALADAIREMLTLDRYKVASEAVAHARRDLSWYGAAETTIEAYRSVWRDGSKTDRPKIDRSKTTVA